MNCSNYEIMLGSSITKWIAVNKWLNLLNNIEKYHRNALFYNLNNSFETIKFLVIELFYFYNISRYYFITFTILILRLNY